MRRRERERRYQAVLDSIERLEYELGLTTEPPRRVGLRTARDAEAKWRASVAKAANYATGATADATAVERIVDEVGRGVYHLRGERYSA